MSSARFDENRSCWLSEATRYEAGDPLREDVAADVAIVGGGLTGVSTAWHLAERAPGLRIVLLEAVALAAGASGRNGGQVLNGINGVEPSTAEEARRQFEATKTGIDIVEALAAHSTEDAGFAQSGCLEVATTAASAAAMAARAAGAEKWGLPQRWVEPDSAGLAGAFGALRDPTAARVNAAALVRGLRRPLAERGVAIYEGTPVESVEESAAGIRLRTSGGAIVSAATLVLATNAYTPSLGYFRFGVLPLLSHAVATRPLDAATWDRIGWKSHVGFSDDLDRIAYGCRTPGGRLLFGGGSNASYTYLYGGRTDSRTTPAATRERAFAAIEAKLRAYFPALADAPIEHRWTGPLAITFDRVCSMGRTGRSGNVLYALGYSGHGLALAALAGCVLADAYSGDDERWRGLPFYQKRLPPIPPEPLRSIGYHIYTRATGRSPRRR